jgi:hypothetical protein
MKKLFFLSIFLFGFLRGMDQEEEISVEPLDQAHYDLLVHHVAAMTILLKKSFPKDPRAVPCNDFRFSSIESTAYLNFTKKYGSYDVKNIIDALLKDDDELIITELESYYAATQENLDIYHYAKIDQNQLKHDVQKKLTKKQIKFFNSRFIQGLPTADVLWKASRIQLLEELQGINKNTASPETVAKLCDTGCLYGSGAAAGFGLAALTWGPGCFCTGIGCMFLGIAQGLLWSDDSCLRFANYYKQKQEMIDKKLKHTIDQLLLSDQLHVGVPQTLIMKK